MGVEEQDKKQDGEAFWNTFLNGEAENITEEYDFLSGEPFGQLFQAVIAAFLAWVQPDGNRFRLLNHPAGSVIRMLYSGIRDIPMRVCIYDMGKQKQNGIMREYEKRCGVDAKQRQIMERMQDSIISRVLERGMILPQERYAPGMMAGLAGIGCVLADIS